MLLSKKADSSVLKHARNDKANKADHLAKQIPHS